MNYILFAAFGLLIISISIPFMYCIKLVLDKLLNLSNCK